MVKKLVFILVLFLVSSVSFTQSNQEKINSVIEEGTACLKNREQNCQDVFTQAIDQANELGNDSILCETLYSIGKKYYHIGGNPELSLNYLNRCVSITKSAELPEIRFSAYYEIADIYSFQGNYQQVNLYHDSAVFIAKGLDDMGKLAAIQVEQAWALQNQGKYKEAYELLIATRDISLENETDFNPYEVDANLGTVCAMNDDYDLAMDHFQHAYEGNLSLGDSARAFVSLTNICNCSLFQSKADKKVISDLESVVAFYKSQGIARRYIFPMAQLGRAHSILKNYEKGNEVLLETIRICDDIGAHQQSAYASTLLSDNYRKLSDFENALIYSTKSYEFQKSQPVSQEHLTALEQHAGALNDGGFYQRAMEIQLEYQAAKDSLYDLNKASEIARIQEELAVEKIQNELLLQENEVFRLEKEREAIFKRNIFLVIGLLLTAIVAVFLVQRKSSQVKLKELQNEKLTSTIEAKNKELTEKALHLAQKNSLLASLKSDLEKLEKKNQVSDSSVISSKISFDTKMDENWEQFVLAFKQTRSGFFEAIGKNHPDCSKSDLRLAALLSMNLGSKEIASILNISDMGVKKARYRLRKKLSLDSDTNLESYLNTIS